MHARAIVVGCTLALLLCSPVCFAADAPAGAALAWIRFEDASQDWKGTKYRFLGDGALQLSIDVPPAAGHALLLLWGAKDDTREATLIVNGQSLPLKKGGYNGFEWLRVELPAGAIKGDNYEVKIEAAGQSKPAFLGEIRLMGSGGAPGGDLKAASFKISLKTVASTVKRFQGEAFPEMRKLWDRQPAPPAADTPEEKLFRKAEANARQAAEGYYRCIKFVHGWLAHADPKTGLIPRNLTASRDFWNGRDAAADNWPFMVLTSFFTDKEMFEGRMKQMLVTEIKLTCRVDRLCDNFSFSKQGWAREKVDLDAIMFDSIEYVKDGLLPITEWLGQSPWSDRMIGLIDDAWKNAPIDTPGGTLPTLNFEVNGDLLQACSRLYWFTGDRKYLDWAIRIGDYYLLGDKHPTRSMKTFPLSDHGCEVTNGLSELYLACSFAAPQKRDQYKAPLHELYQAILKHGVNEHGQMWTSMTPSTGEHSKSITDNWGYNYDGIYTAYLVDKKEEYRAAVRRALENLKQHYTGHAWQGGSADGYADSIEGAINLLNREPVESAWEWVDSEIKVMWGKQQPSGVIEGWHGDGNSARTTIMYCLAKSQGTWITPWREDVRLGAVRDGDAILISLSADKAWSGKLHFDKPRHKVNLKLPIDYPRINQFPEWFVTDAGATYTLGDKTYTGAQLQSGIPITLNPNQELRLRATAVK